MGFERTEEGKQERVGCFSLPASSHFLKGLCWEAMSSLEKCGVILDRTLSMENHVSGLQKSLLQLRSLQRLHPCVSWDDLSKAVYMPWWPQDSLIVIVLVGFAAWLYHWAGESKAHAYLTMLKCCDQITPLPALCWLSEKNLVVWFLKMAFKRRVSSMKRCFKISKTCFFRDFEMAFILKGVESHGFDWQGKTFALVILDM